MKTKHWSVIIFLSISTYILGQEGGNLLPNGSFEQGTDGWSDLWTRDKGVGKLELDKSEAHSGNSCVKIIHTGDRDWSLSIEKRLPVKFGEMYEYEGWFKVEGDGEVILCAIAYASDGKVIDWEYGSKRTSQTAGWVNLKSKFIISQDIAAIVPRIIGSKKATIYADDLILKRAGELKPQKKLPDVLTLENKFIRLDIQTADGVFHILDKRLNQTWNQKANNKSVIVLDANKKDQSIELSMHYAPAMIELKANISIERDAPEFLVELQADGKMDSLIYYPYPFVTEKGTYLVVPMNEGISYPVDDTSIEPMRLVSYGGHGICMGFWGVTDGEKAQMTILETADDSSIQIARVDNLLSISPVWESQKGFFGYPRRLRYSFFDNGGYVAICKRYREYSKKIGLFKTLKEKQKENPNVDLLIGAVNIWCFDKNALPYVSEVKEAGIEKILWSNAQNPENLKKLNEMGVLTSRYDIYQDVMNPDNFKYLRGIHSDWTTEAWPNDIIIDAKGKWIHGWAVKGKDDQWYPCGVLCDKRAVDYAKKRIPQELKTYPYRCRFIDTTTASPWRECYSPNHPMTRTESKIWKMKLLQYVSEDMKLVTGSETGHEAAVPYVHYFEGMLSLGPYRVPDSGRNIQKIWDNPPERVVKFQLGHRYRLPLWELVYHDCVVAQWYWGDYNNKLPSLWDKRDLFNTLYGTPPMFIFNRQIWEQNKDRFAKSYKTICPLVQKIGYSEMISHKFLTPDRDVQQTEFANKVKVTVNFGEKDYKFPNGKIIKPMDLLVEGI